MKKGKGAVPGEVAHFGTWHNLRLVPDQDRTLRWDSTHSGITAHLVLLQRGAALVGLVSMLLTITVNEMLIRGVKPEALVIDALKAGNSTCALAGLVLCLLRYRCREAALRLRVRMRYHMETARWPHWFWSVVLRPTFWAEAILCVVHLPSQISFTFRAVSMGNVIVYHAETIDCSISILRVYLLAPLVVHEALADLPSRFAIANMAKIDIGASFALKRAFSSWRAPLYVMCAWAFSVLVLGYWFRSVEVTACQDYALAADAASAAARGDSHHFLEARATAWTVDGARFFNKTNDLYIQNAMFLVMITSAAVGYGDLVPSTFLGRVIAGLASVMGLILSALMTATISKALRLTHAEHVALRWLRDEELKARMQQSVVAVLQSWWRHQRCRTGWLAQRLVQRRMKFNNDLLAAQAHFAGGGS